MKYYITNEKTIKRVPVASNNIGAFQNIFFDTFGEAKNYLEKIYPTDLATSVKYCTPNIEIIEDYEKELDFVKHRYEPLFDEYKEYDLDIFGFKDTKEWEERKAVAEEYFHKEGQYLFYFLDYKDKQNKNRLIFNKNNCLLPTYVGFHGALTRDVARDDELNGIKQQIREIKTQELKELEEEYHVKLEMLEEEYTNARLKYLAIQAKYRDSNKRRNDLKNTIIDYTYKHSALEEKIIINKLWLYSTVDDSGIVVKDLKDLNIDDIKYSNRNGYNIYVIKNNEVFKVKYIGNSYNRIGILDEENKIVRQNAKILIDTYADGDSLLYLDRTKDFIDKDELFLAKETKLNDKLDNFYGKNVLR